MVNKRQSKGSLVAKVLLGAALYLNPLIMERDYAEAGQLNEVQIQRIVDKAYSTNKNLPPEIEKEFVKAIIYTESNGRDDAKSRVGARGLMQIMEPTWKDITNRKYDEAYNAQINVNVGVEYLRRIWRYCEKNNPNWSKLNKDERLRLIAASYNGGMGRLRRSGWKIEKMPGETRKYVVKVMSRYKR